jgi:formate dehydrogenase major subunit
MFSLPLSSHPQPSKEPFSPMTAAKTSRLRGATVTESVCPYCAVGCGQLIYTKGGQIIDIEGNPESPINEGTLCPKGANAFQLAVNPHRVTHVMYRAPFSDKWETRSLDWALDQIAARVKAARDAELTANEVSGEQSQGSGAWGQTDAVSSLTPDASPLTPSTIHPSPLTPHHSTNSVRSIGTLGGATIDNEENYLIKKLFGGGLGVVSIENQARI